MLMHEPSPRRAIAELAVYGLILAKIFGNDLLSPTPEFPSEGQVPLMTRDPFALTEIYWIGRKSKLGRSAPKLPGYCMLAVGIPGTLGS